MHGSGGNLEINFGPAGDGRLPTAMVQPLLGTGRWLSINGQSIYNTTGFPFGRNASECTADVVGAPVAKCFTQGKDGSIYVIYLNWPTVAGSSPHTAAVSLDHLIPTPTTTVTLLGSEATVIKTSGGKGSAFVFEVPNLSPAALRCELDLCHAFVFKITHASNP